MDYQNIFYTTVSLAAHLGVTPVTIQRMVEDDILSVAAIIINGDGDCIQVFNLDTAINELEGGDNV